MGVKVLMKIKKGWYLLKGKSDPVYVTSVKNGRVYWDIGKNNRCSEELNKFINGLENPKIK